MRKRIYQTTEEFERRFFPKTYAKRVREAAAEEQGGTGLMYKLLRGLRKDLGLANSQ